MNKTATTILIVGGVAVVGLLFVLTISDSISNAADSVGSVVQSAEDAVDEIETIGKALLDFSTAGIL